LNCFSLDDAGFKSRFAGTPVLRTKRRGLLRNVCVALGNTGDASALPHLQKAAADSERVDCRTRALGGHTSTGVTNKYLFSEGSVRNPSSKIMLAEEPGTIQSWDNPNAGSGGEEPISDGRWIPSPLSGRGGDPLTIRHGGKADVAFADGHVLPVTPDFGWDTNNNLSEQ
jgi:prepilin-type processing-associated H-X9-DG protein